MTESDEKPVQIKPNQRYIKIIFKGAANVNKISGDDLNNGNYKYAWFDLENVLKECNEPLMKTIYEYAVWTDNQTNKEIEKEEIGDLAESNSAAIVEKYANKRNFNLNE